MWHTNSVELIFVKVKLVNTLCLLGQFKLLESLRSLVLGDFQ